MKNKIVAIIGLGMLGGSLGARLLKEQVAHKIIGYARRQETVEFAINHQIIHEGSTDLPSILQQADIVIFCTPIPTTIELVKTYQNSFKTDAIVTDIGSTKGSVVKLCQEILEERGISFIGGHPMAGSEKFGIEFFKIDMYDQATVFISPTHLATAHQIELLDQLWRGVKANPFLIDANKHDEVVAFASQALHVVASASAIAVLDNEDGQLCSAASAGGFRDLTRIASSNPVMWREIIENNPEGNLIALNHIIKELQAARDLIAHQNWQGVEDFFRHGKNLRDQWLELRAKN